MAARTRLVSLDDVASLTALVRANRAFLEPFSPDGTDEDFTEDGQAAKIITALTRWEHDQMLPHVIIDTDGEIVGRINLNSIIRGAAQSASVGYWVAQDRNSRGIATAAVAALVEVGFGRLGLHRIQGEVLPGNTASRKVLERNGFERIGVARQFLHIGGAWQDHILFQRVNGAWHPREPGGA